MHSPGPWNAPPGFGPPPQQPAGASQQAIIALVLAVVGFMGCGCLTSIPAIFIARAELKAIDAGLSSAGGRSIAQIAFWLGIADTALITLVLAIYVVFFVFGFALFAAGV
jgi:hypothetical protein